MSVAETLRQLIEGRDFSPPARLLNLDAERACRQIPGVPYSIAANVWHADFWQRIWLARLRGEKRPSNNVFKDDWQVPPPQDWPSVRASFLSGLEAALEIAESQPFSHAMKSDEEAIKVLNQIAVHASYHVGQVALLKRMLRRTATGEPGGDKTE